MALKRSKRIVIDKALDWKTFNLAESIKSFYMETDEEGNLKALPVILIDPNASIVTLDSTKIQGLPRVGIRDSASGNVANVDAYAMQGLSATRYMLNVAAAMLVYNPNAPGPSMEGFRTPSTFKNVIAPAAAATTDLWAPAAGKKFRLLGGVIIMSGLIAIAAIRNLTLIEETAGTVIARACMTIPVLGGTAVVPFDLGPNGFLASTANKKLQVVTATSNYSVGQDVVMCWGTEE